MLEIVISWNYYKENVRFSSWNARQKRECVYFYDYDEFIGYIIKNMEYSELQKLRFNIYQKYLKLIKFTPFKESDKDWNTFEWYKLSSPNIKLDSDDFAKLIPYKDTRKRYFMWDSVRERYYYKSDFINYVQLHYV